MVSLQRARTIIKRNFDTYERGLLDGKEVSTDWSVTFCKDLSCGTCPLMGKRLCLGPGYFIYYRIYHAMCTEIELGNIVKALGLLYTLQDKVLGDISIKIKESRM